jgi:hypothetical protein
MPDGKRSLKRLSTMDATFPFRVDSAILVAFTILRTWKWLSLMTLLPLLVSLLSRTRRTSHMARVRPGGPFGKINPPKGNMAAF